MAQTYLVTGANRGLGLEFARQLAKRGDQIIGTAREPEKATELARLVHSVVALDLLDPTSVSSLGGRLGDRPIDVLINNAGISSSGKSIETLDALELQRAFIVNSIGPLMVARSVLKNLRASKRKLVFNISSQLGSVANNRGGSSYAYRASKAALNQLTVSLANELRPRGFICVVAHPGWVKTDMGGPGAPMTAEDSVGYLLKLIDRLQPEDSGQFFNYDGKQMAW